MFVVNSKQRPVLITLQCQYTECDNGGKTALGKLGFQRCSKEHC